MLKWSTDLEKFEIVNGKFGEIGAIARLHYNQKGRKSIMEDKLEYIEPGKKIISQVSGEGLKARVEAVFTSINNETEIELTCSGRGENMIFRLILSVMRKKIMKQSEVEIRKFKELVEKYEVKFK